MVDVPFIPKETLSKEFGTIMLKMTVQNLLNNTVLLRHSVGESIFHLYSDTQFNLVFSHYSSKTGIRESKVNLEEFNSLNTVLVAFRWSEKENYLYVSEPEKSIVKASRGESRGGRLRIDENGAIYQIGDNGLEIGSYRFVEDGKNVLLPYAKEVWNSTITKVNVLIDGCKLKDYLFEATVVQQCIVMLVTGLEVYTKNRFLEMEQIGKNNANSESLLKEFANSTDVRKDVEDYSASNNISILQSLIKIRGHGLINFQDWDKCKRAFNKGYNIKFGKLPDLKPVILENIPKYCQWRHKIIHSKINMEVLNMEEVPPKEPIFANKEFIEKARDEFIDFIEKLHKQTV